jgi:hypothetical protein
MSMFIVSVISSITFAICNGFLAKHKGRDVLGWVMTALFCGPISTIFLLCMPHKKDEVRKFI